MAVAKNRTAKAKTFSVAEVPISKLKAAPYNPISRQRAIEGLLQSMEDNGLLIPILITPKFQIIEGHRRVAAAKKLEWTTIKAVFANGDPAKLFAEANTHVRRFNGNETLRSYLENPNSVGTKAQKQIEDAIKAVGRPTINRLAKEGISLATYWLAKRACTYCDIKDSKTVAVVLNWMLAQKNQQTVKEILSRRLNMGEIIVAARKGKPIKVAYSS